MIFGIFGGKKKEEVLIGEVVHFFPKVKAAIIKVNKEKVAIGDRIRIKGHTTNFDQTIKSMQIEHELVESVKKGEEVAVKVGKKVRRGDQVFLLK
ncbi:MAG: translation elongation factor-like protein [Candidatus Omnitrophota bacterium]